MAKENSVGIIEDDVLYTADELRKKSGKSLQEMKSFIREHCVHSEPWEGNLWVVGIDFKRAIIEIGKVDTEEARAARVKKSGAAARTRKAGKT